MTPEEHYDEAERLSAALADTVYLSGGRPIKTDDKMMVTDAAWNAVARRAELHAKLAEVGLALRESTPLPLKFADDIDERNDSFAKAHNFPSNTMSEALCQKCGRCWQHKGAECAGGQQHSTAKACLVCANWYRTSTS